MFKRREIVLMTFEEWGRENVSIFDDAGIEWTKTFLFEAYRAGQLEMRERAAECIRDIIESFPHSTVAYNTVTDLPLEGDDE
jgi:ketosteroid isomerase-like protein